VIPTEDTVSVEQYEKAASPGSVLHMLIYTAYKKQLQQPPDQVNSPVVSVFRNHWPPKFQYPNESLPAEVAAGTKVNNLLSVALLFVDLPFVCLKFSKLLHFSDIALLTAQVSVTEGVLFSKRRTAPR
jgi:hypothetical protein